MGLFGGQFSSVVEWKEYSDDIIFWKFPSSEIKKGSRLIIRPGQDAIFMYNGRIEGIFREEGNFDVSSDIIPFLSTIKLMLIPASIKSTTIVTTNAIRVIPFLFFNMIFPPKFFYFFNFLSIFIVLFFRDFIIKHFVLLFNYYLIFLLNMLFNKN